MVSWGNLADQLEQWATSKYALFKGTFGGFPDIHTFAKHPENPIIAPSGAGWDDDHVEMNDVLRGDDGKFWIYYLGSPGDAIGLARSDDLVTWTKEATNPVLDVGPAGAWDEDEVGDAKVLYDGSEYHMLYTGMSGGTKKLGHATSDNGVDWTKDSNNPVLDRPSGVPFFMSGGFYYQLTVGTLRRTEDFVEWETVTDEVGFGTGPTGAWDSRHVALYNVVAMDGIWVAAYQGTNPDGHHYMRNGLALSIDGEHWVKYPGNPVLSPSPSTAWDNTGVEDPVLLTWDGKLYMFYSGEGDVTWSQIGMAETQLGDLASGDYFENDARGPWNAVSIDAGESTYGIPTLGYDSITIKFLSDTAGLLDVETQEPDGDWQVLLDDLDISANTLKEVNLGGLQGGIRLTFDSAATVSAWYELS